MVIRRTKLCALFVLSFSVLLFSGCGTHTDVVLEEDVEPLAEAKQFLDEQRFSFDINPPEGTPNTSYYAPTNTEVIAVADDEEDQDIADAVNMTLLTLPRWLRSAFSGSGWEMHVVSYDIASTDYEEVYSDGQVYGSTAYSERIIKIQNTPVATVIAPVHEFGHWFDAQLGYPSFYSQAFLDLWETEGSLFKEGFNPSGTWDIHEFIAEGFCCYWQAPVALQRTCPEFYNFLEYGLTLVRETYLES